MKKYFILVIAVLLIGTANYAEAITVDYASIVSDSNAINPTWALGKPDGMHAMFGNDNPPFLRYGTYSGFGQGDVVTYDSANFASLFGISEVVLSSADFFITEYNGGYNTMFESGEWLFGDGVNSNLVFFDSANPSVGGAVLAYGNINIAAYNSFFGLPSGTGTGGEWTYLLLDVGGNSTVNMYSSNFTVKLTAQDTPGSGEDPDPDAMGRITKVPVPEPSSMILLGIGLFGAGLVRRRAK